MATRFDLSIVAQLASFAVMGIAGIALNIVIARFYSVDVLGSFNQVFAFYIVVSQFCVFGIQYSVLRYVPTESQNVLAGQLKSLVSSAILLSLLYGVIVCLFFYLVAGHIANLLNSELVRIGLLCVIPGTMLFGVNKVCLNVINGLQYMILFSVLQSLRYFMIMALLVVFILFEVRGEYLPLILTMTEVVVVIVCLFFLATKVGFTVGREFRKWLRLHFLFGAKSFLNGAVSELNTRVDILMLGVFLQDSYVGLYSMASMLAEGFMQLSVVLKNTMNPIIARFAATGEMTALKEFIRLCGFRFFMVMGVVGIVAIPVYPFLVNVLTGSDQYLGSWPIFSVLIFTTVLVSFYMPLDLIMSQTGFPGIQTAVKATVLLVNIGSNWLLIPVFGLLGGAMGTGLSLICYALLTKIAAKRFLGITI